MVYFITQELRKQFETISDLRTEIKSLQADNLKLYEKVRYMQSYRNDATAGYPLSGSNVTGSSSSSSNFGGGGKSGGAGLLNGAMRNRDDEIGRYKDKYEESMNPFEVFKGKVSGYGAGSRVNRLKQLL